MADRRILADLALGALAGLAATWLMDKATTALYELEPKNVKKRENAARGGKTAYESAAVKGAGLIGRRLSTKERKSAGAAIHWTLGASAGAAYGLLRNRRAALPYGSGLAYGALFWLAMDEAALTALRLTPPPQRFPWQTHLRGLAGHLVLGGTLEAAFEAVDAL